VKITALLTPAEVAERLKLSPDAVRNMFRHYPGVIQIAGEKHPKRITIRIPEPVLERFMKEREVA
jgi:hypothetical protein